MRICFLSNGYGEDKAAAAIAGRLRDGYTGVEVVAAPMVTAGDCYSKLGIPLLTSGRLPPSGGFPLKSLKGFVLDCGCVLRYTAYTHELARRRSEIDRAVAVGDVTLLSLAALSLRGCAVFVDLAKSSHKGSHYRIEEAILRRIGCRVLARDDHTCRDLSGKGIDALYLGNPMMDGLGVNRIGLGDEPTVGLLPGSRSEVGANLLSILRVVEMLPAGVAFVCAISPSLPVEGIIQEVARDGWEGDSGSLGKDGRTVLLLRDGFAEMVSRARVVIGLAGSANEQAAGLGIPVVSFVGRGPQTTARRMRDQERLMGGAVRFVRGHPEGVAAEVMRLLADPEARAARGAIGISRMGPPGASEAIARFLACEFGLESTRAIAA